MRTDVPGLDPVNLYERGQAEDILGCLADMRRMTEKETNAAAHRLLQGARYSGTRYQRQDRNRHTGRTGGTAVPQELSRAGRLTGHGRTAEGGTVSRQPTRAEGARSGDAAAWGNASAERVLTVPNLISFARLLGVPLFLYLFLVARNDVAAVVVLALGGTTDWVDGWVARRLRQVSRLGELLDPAADRLYIVATLLAFTLREVVPWQFAAALVARELFLGVWLLVLRRHGYGPPQVHYLGKTGTFVLLAAFPVLLLAATVPAAEPVAHAVGWALAWWGLALYWAAGALYVIQALTLIRAVRRADRAGAA